MSNFILQSTDIIKPTGIRNFRYGGVRIGKELFHDLRKAIFENILYWCGVQDIMINPQQSTGTDIGTCGYVFHCDLFSKMGFNVIKRFFDAQFLFLRFRQEGIFYFCVNAACKQGEYSGKRRADG